MVTWSGSSYLSDVDLVPDKVTGSTPTPVPVILVVSSERVGASGQSSNLGKTSLILQQNWIQAQTQPLAICDNLNLHLTILLREESLEGCKEVPCLDLITMN